LKKLLEKHKEHELNALHKKEEYFQRIKCKGLIRLMQDADYAEYMQKRILARKLQHEAALQAKMEEEEAQRNQMYSPHRSHRNSYAGAAEQTSPTSPSAPFATGSDWDVENTSNRAAQSKPVSAPNDWALSNDEKPPPLLLVDIRSPESFENVRIMGTINHPAPKFSHATNPFSPELFLALRNPEDSLVIIIDEKESIGLPLCNSLNEKGYNNIRLLSGGLSAMAAQYPELLQGDIQSVPLLSARSSRMSSNSSVCGSARRGYVPAPRSTTWK
jgi:rhodanese-related sulfurtransferase